MINRQNGVELNRVEEKSFLSSILDDSTTQEKLQFAQNSLFTVLFGSSIAQSFSNYLMVQQGSFTFTTALFVRIANIIASTYHFYQQKNKNLSETSHYIWDVVSGLAIGAALIGSIFFAPSFVVAGGAIFTAVFGLDTIRNLFLTGFNLIRWGMLAFTTRNDKDPLTQVKYDQLKKKYAKNAYNHSLWSIVGIIGTAATAVIFLFPHIGLGAVGTLAVGKATLAGVLGVFAGAGFVAPAVVPKILDGMAWVGKKLKGLFSRPAPQLEEQQPLLAARPAVVNVPAQPKLRINTVEELAAASNHKIDHLRFMNDSEDRKLLIKHINSEDPALALVAIQNMVEEKMEQLTQQLAKKNWLDDRQEYKRRQKLEALTKINDYLNFVEVRNDKNLKIENVDSLIDFIDRKYPAVDQSFFRNESDTRNVLKALKAYGKFEKTDVNAQAIRRGLTA